MENAKTQNAFLAFARIGCGIVAIVLILWTPQSGRAIGLYLGLLILLIALGFLIFRGPRERYRPHNLDRP